MWKGVIAIAALVPAESWESRTGSLTSYDRCPARLFITGVLAVVGGGWCCDCVERGWDAGASLRPVCTAEFWVPAPIRGNGRVSPARLRGCLCRWWYRSHRAHCVSGSALVWKRGEGLDEGGVFEDG